MRRQWLGVPQHPTSLGGAMGSHARHMAAAPPRVVVRSPLRLPAPITDLAGGGPAH